MAWSIETCKATLLPVEKKRFTAEQIRGFFGYLFLEDEGFHHHGEGNPYTYPKIQYKKLGDEIVLLGLGDYVSRLKSRVQEVESILVPSGELNIHGIEMSVNRTILAPEVHDYEFITPWIALNQHNYRLFKGLPDDRKREELERILTGNILSFLKAFGIFIDFRLHPVIKSFRPVKVRVNNNEFEAFDAKFTVNISLPELIGLGKSVSKGFGTIKEAGP